MTTAIQLAYLVAAVLFILGLRNLSSPKTAVLGNNLAATGMLIAIVENHQVADGRIRVPEPLRPYLRGREFLGEAIR